jgi:hypothetical protein
MNAPKYTLVIKNKSSQFKKFAIFQTLRNMTEASVKPMPLAWAVGAAAPGNGEQSSSFEFSWKPAYNISLINSYHMGNEMLQTNSVEAPVSPDGAHGYTVTYCGDFPIGAPDFVGSITESEKGCLLIKSDGRIPTIERQCEENCFLKVGFSMAGRQVSVADLQPDATYRFSLDPVYRITVGEFFPGQAIGDASHRKSCVVNFGDDGRKTIILGADDSFSDEK